MRIFKKLKRIIPIIIFLSLGNSLWGAVAGNNTYNLSNLTGFSKVGNNIVHEHFVISGQTEDGTTMDMKTDADPDIYGSTSDLGSQMNATITIAADGTNTGSFEFTGVSLYDFNAGTANASTTRFTNITIVGNLLGGGTVTSVNNVDITTSGSANGIDQSNLDLSNFSGKQITSCEIRFYINRYRKPDNLTLTGFTIQNAQAPASSAPAQDTDATLTAGTTVVENTMISLPSTVHTLDQKVNLFDFKITDVGTSDNLTTDVTQIVIYLSGSTNHTVRGQIKWILNGTNVSNKEGTYDAGNNSITFSSLGISVPNGGNETYILSAYFSVQSALTDNSTFRFSINGSSDVTVDTTKTKMATGQSPITNSNNAKVDITATKLMFQTEPSNISTGI